jgi:hypothetical protein
MNRICWWLVDVVSRMLEPAERDVVCGDFTESAESAGRALRGVLSLVVRRQAALWRDWRPWLALVGLVGAVAAVLSEIAFKLDVDISQQAQAYSHYGVRVDTGLAAGQDIVHLACLSAALFLWSWVSGFVLGSLSGRAIWLTGALFYLVILDSFTARLLISGNATFRNAHVAGIIVGMLVPLDTFRASFLVFAIWGVRRGLWLRALEVRPTVILAVAVVILTSLVTWTSGWYETAHETWSGGVWRGAPWQTRVLPLALVSWPVGYMLATATCQRWHTKTVTY